MTYSNKAKVSFTVASFLAVYTRDLGTEGKIRLFKSFVLWEMQLK